MQKIALSHFRDSRNFTGQQDLQAVSLELLWTIALRQSDTRLNTIVPMTFACKFQGYALFHLAPLAIK